MPDPRIAEWKAVFDRSHSETMELVRLTALIITEPAPGIINTPEDRRAALLLASEGNLDESTLDWFVKIHKDLYPENALMVFRSASPIRLELLALNGHARMKIMSKPIAVLEYRATSVRQHALKHWNELTGPDFRRSVDLVRQELISLDDQLAHVGRRKPTKDKYIIGEKSVHIPKRCDLTPQEVVNIVTEISRLGVWTPRQVKLLMRAIAPLAQNEPVNK